MTILEMAALAGSALIAGAMNAVAGGGTILTFPTLLAVGTPPRVANATSTLALFVGTAGSIYGFRRHWAAISPWLLRFAPVSVLGGFIGSLLLTRTSESAFSRFVPFLILFATVLFLLQGILRRFIGSSLQMTAPDRPHRLWLAVLFQFCVAIYGGYFGAGIGILMLATLGFIGLHDIHEMNALKNLLGSLINLVATVCFIVAGLVQWPKALVMTVGALLGYYAGSRYSQRIPQARVRQIIATIGFTLSAVTFYREFLLK